MKVEQRSSGSYRVRKTYKNKTYTLSFDHKPTQKEVSLKMAEIMTNYQNAVHGTFQQKAAEYIDVKSNVLSPSTIGGYEKVLRCLPDWFKQMRIDDIDSVKIQKVINDYSVGRSPKTVKNVYGFITAVFGLFKPTMVISVTIPQSIKYEPYLPKISEVMSILEAVKDTDYSIPFQLGVLGLRRSEVCALTIDDLNGNTLTINKAYVYDSQNKPIIKPYTKTTEGTRQIFLPDALCAEIRQKGYIFNKQPHNLVRVLHEKQSELGIKSFRFHDLRHFYASYAHQLGMSDAEIMSTGGWSSDYTMKSVYRHAMQENTFTMQQKVANQIIK